MLVVAGESRFRFRLRCVQGRFKGRKVANFRRMKHGAPEFNYFGGGLFAKKKIGKTGDK